MTQQRYTTFTLRGPSFGDVNFVVIDGVGYPIATAVGQLLLMISRERDDLLVKVGVVDADEVLH